MRRSTRETRSSRNDLASRIYGLLVVGAALAVARPRAHSQWTVFLDAFAAAAVYSAAHVYSHLLDERMRQSRPLTMRERRVIAANGLAILRATGVPFLILVVCSALRIDDATAITAALWVVVGELAVTTWLASEVIRPWWRRCAYAVGAIVLGLLLILLKIVTH